MAASFTIVFTPTGEDAVTLCDLADKWWPVLEQLPAEGVEQVDRLAFGGVVARVMRGNVSGEVVFSVSHSHASLDEAAGWYATMRGQVALSGKLEITINTVVLTFLGATFRRLEPTLMEGCRWTLRYSFGVTELDNEQFDLP
jgi:hypothetical protein